MELPKLDFKSPESFIAFYIVIIYSISVYSRSIATHEYLYFYLCNMRLLFSILAIIIIAAVILGIYIRPLHVFILKLILLYTALTGVYWYRGLPLSFMDAIQFFLLLLLFVVMVVVTLVIFIILSKILSIFFSWYDGNLKIILFFKDVHDTFTDHNSSERYRSLTHWNLDDEEEQVLKFTSGFFVLILLSFSVLYLPSVLSSTSPRFYDIYTIHGEIKAEVDNEYPMDELIYIPVEVGGLDTGLSIILLKYNSDEFEEISSLTLCRSKSNTQKNNSLSGEPNTLGSYKVYLNPTSMSTGDYELKFESIQNKNINMSKVFSLKPK